MAVETLPDGFPTVPILATVHGNELYAFLEQVFQAELLDRHIRSDGELAYMTVRIGDSVISVMKPAEGTLPTRSAFYVYVPDVDLVHERAVNAGARSLHAPVEAVHGDRMATIFDAFENQWTIATRIEQVSVEELHRRLAKQ